MTKNEDFIVVYVSGAITGQPDRNRQAFLDAGKSLRERGFKPIIPVENFHSAAVPSLRYKYMRRDILQVLESDAVVVLPGWKQSRGARLEVAIAIELNIPVINLEDLSQIEDDVQATVSVESNPQEILKPSFNKRAAIGS